MKALLLTLITTGLLQVSNLGSGMLAAQLLAPAGRGELAAAILWPTTIAYLLLFGLNDSVLYNVASRRLTSRQAFAASLSIGAALSAIGMVLGYVVVIPLAYADYAPSVGHLATLLLLIIPLNIFGTIYMELLRGNLKLGIWNVLRVVGGVAYFVIVLGFVWAGKQDVEAFGISYLLAQLPAVVVGMGVAILSGWGAIRAARQTLRPLLTYGAQIHASTVVNIVNARIDQMLIATTLDATSLGLYVVATTLSQVTATLASSVTLIAYPKASAVADRDDRIAVIGLYLRITLVLIVGSTLVLGLAAPLLLGLLFGPGFVEATLIVQILVLGVIPLAIKDFFVLAFKAFDRPLVISKGEVVTLVANAALLGLLVPSFGLIGAAIASVGVRWISMIYFGTLLRRGLAIPLLVLLRPTRSDLDLARDAMQRLRSSLTGRH